MDDRLAELFLASSRFHLCTEYRVKIRLAVEALPAEDLWRCPNDESNSVGNLLLHLSGNLRQWIVSGVGGDVDARDRASEFSARGGASAADLLDALDRTLDDVDRVLSGLTASGLAELRAIQGRDVTVLAAVLHVVEHFSYHLGQIVLVAKVQTPGRLRFYEDSGGLARPIWNQ